jgi:hypothetical protein
METEFSQERAATLRDRIRVANEVGDTMKKIHTAVLRVALDSPSAQKQVLKAAYKKAFELHEAAPTDLKKSLKMVVNELTSLIEGVDAKLVSSDDLMLQSTKLVLTNVQNVIEYSTTQLKALGENEDENHAQEWREIITKNGKFAMDVHKAAASIDKSGFGFARVPVSLTFVRNIRNKHSSVGYLNLELLSDLGFKAKMIGGYAVIYGQVIIGVDPRGAYNVDEHTDDKGKVTKMLSPKKTTERVTKFTKDVGGIVDKKRNMSALDIAKEYKQLLEAKTRQKYSFVSEKPHGYKGNSYFWLMPDRDLSRFAKAFPGKHVGMDSWGFAF